LPEETLHKLESVTFAAFAPIFFGIVGIKVDLWRLDSGSMLLNVLGVATAGKLVGCTIGSLLGGLTLGESLSIAVAMNARGAMELVAATIGMRVARRSAHPLTVLYVERVSGWSSRLFGSDEGKNLSQHLDKVRAMASAAGLPAPEVRKQTSRDVVRTIGAESAKGYDLMLVGASESRHGIRGEKLEKLVA